MQICFDNRNTGRSGGTGVATYATALADASKEAGFEVTWLSDGEKSHRAPRRLDERLKRQCRAFSASRKVKRTSAEHYECYDLYRTAHVRFQQTGRLSTLSASQCPDIMHWTYPLPITWPGTRNILTIHDLIPLINPDLTDISGTRMRHLLEACCQKAQAIVTVSESVRRDILEQLPISEDKVFNFYQTVDFSSALLKEAECAPDITEPGGFLYFGSIEKRKNIARLIEAHGRSGSSRPLTLIGAHGYRATEELAAIASHPKGEELIRQIPWCPRASLIRAIIKARAVLFPSLAEGFGLPVLEAMTLGTSVMTSQSHALGEIAGDAAILVDPYSLPSMTQAIKTLDENDTACSELIQKGLRHSSKFAKDIYAHKLAAFYREQSLLQLPL
ncbi:hypothetical protein A0U90_02935 [Kozakia baliensis]|nr:hypothetical protein A0U90_02935 [Kozakia baliensis]